MENVEKVVEILVLQEQNAKKTQNLWKISSTPKIFVSEKNRTKKVEILRIYVEID